MRLRTYFIAVLAIGVNAQSVKRSADEVIRHLTFQDGRPGAEYRRIGIGGCGETAYREDQQLAQDLVRFGRQALPALERSLKSIEKRGESSPYVINAGWLLAAYARIAGKESVARLRAMRGSSVMTFVRGELDDALAIARNVSGVVGQDSNVGARFCTVNDAREALRKAVWESLKGVSDGPAKGDQRKDRPRNQNQARPTKLTMIAFRIEEPEELAGVPIALDREVPLGDQIGETQREINALVAFFDDQEMECLKMRVRLQFDPTGSPRGGFVVESTSQSELRLKIRACVARRE